MNKKELEPIDWAVNTKVLVWDGDNSSRKVRGHFSHFKHGIYFTFDSGKTSFTGSISDVIPWQHAEIYKECDEKKVFGVGV